MKLARRFIGLNPCWPGRHRSGTKGPGDISIEVEDTASKGTTEGEKRGPLAAADYLANC